MTVMIAHHTETMQKKASNQKHMEQIFHCVDTIKSDLNKCGMRLQEEIKSSSFHAICFDAKGFSVKFKTQDNGPISTITWKYDPHHQILFRKRNGHNIAPFLNNVSDFYVTFFPDANSVLYRIEVNKKEQIRGYFFLLNLVKP